MTIKSEKLLKGRPAPPQASERARLLRVALAAALALSGCSSLPDVAHRIEGGQIAKPRQPPPGVNQPYPNLASVPSRPAPPDQAALAHVFQSLVADRENARHLTTTPASPDPSLPSASPELFGVGTAPPPSAQPAAPPPRPEATATLAAASGPAPPPAQAAAPPAPPAANPAASAAPPDVPASPPPPAEPAPSAPPVPATPPPVPPPAPANAIRLAFEPGSAILPAPAADALRGLAKQRGNHAIAVVGYGDADSANPDTQSKALALGLQRAQAMAQALAADGVPEQSVRLEAQAGGRGGLARLIE